MDATPGIIIIIIISAIRRPLLNIGLPLTPGILRLNPDCEHLKCNWIPRSENDACTEVGRILDGDEVVDSELEELGEQLPRYRPDSIAALRRVTRFTEPELKRLYRGFKAECPTGVVKEDTFKLIYSQFFPQGANTAQYAHYVFNTLDQDRSGLLSFEEFVTGLSVLSRGSLEEKLRWTFSLYDINGDGCITKEEMTDIVTAIYDLMGRVVEPSVEDDIVQQKVERLFQKMDLNRDGVVTLDEFLDCCVRDEDISRSMGVFDSTF